MKDTIIFTSLQIRRRFSLVPAPELCTLCLIGRVGTSLFYVKKTWTLFVDKREVNKKKESEDARKHENYFRKLLWGVGSGKEMV